MRHLYLQFYLTEGDVKLTEGVGIVLGDLLPAPAVAQSDGDGTLRLVLTDDVLVELTDDLAWRQGIQTRRSFFREIDWHQSLKGRRSSPSADPVPVLTDTAAAIRETPSARAGNEGTARRQQARS